MRRRLTAARAAQPTLVKTSGAGTHSNLGKTLEQMLDRSHSRYLSQALGKIEHLPNAWRYANPAEAYRLAAAIRAVTGTGRTMVRARTPWDFHGHYRGMPLALDAKEFGEASIRVEELKWHQAKHLHDFERTGGVAGFLVYAKRTLQLYWIPATLGFRLVEELRLEREGHKKSLNLAWLDEHALTLGTAKAWEAPDYAEQLFRKLWDNQHTDTKAPTSTS